MTDPHPFSGCGICGVLRFDGGTFDGLRADAMCDALRHRGPDARGLFRDDRVFLGNRRLSVLDPSEAGKQPMELDGRHIVHNGEVYNFLEVRDELRRAGHYFRSNTDTEVVLHAYLEWGTACVERFNGMFAFAIWDPAADRLFVARDRLGIKPLYYRYDRDRFAFASEVTSLVASGLFDARLDVDHLQRMLLLGTNMASFWEERTLVRGVVALPPGHWLAVTPSGRVTRSRYWELPAPRPLGERTRAALADELIDLLRSSVALQLRSDAQLAMTLSGGLDSSAITSLAVAASSAGLTAVTVRYVGGGTDPDSGRPDQDAVFAEKVARSIPALDWRVNEVEPAKILSVRTLDRMIDLATLPNDVRMLAGLATFDSLRALGNKVSLSGEGADELFGGYVPTNFYRQSNALLDGQWPEGLFVSAPARASDLQPEVLARVDEVYDAFAEAWRGVDETPLQRTHRFMMGGELPYVLWALDMASMSASIEGRVPFLDHRIAEWAFSFPFEQHMGSDGQGKRLLRDGLAPYLPADVVERPKQLYPAPSEGPARLLLEVCFAEHAAALRGDPLVTSLFRIGDRAPGELSLPALWFVLMVWRMNAVLAALSRGELHARCEVP